MRDISYYVGIASTYAALVLLLICFAEERVREYLQPTATGLVVVGTLMLLWHLTSIHPSHPRNKS